MAHNGATEYSLDSLITRLGEEDNISLDALPLGVDSGPQWLKVGMLFFSLGVKLMRPAVLTSSLSPVFSVAGLYTDRSLLLSPSARR